MNRRILLAIIVTLTLEGCAKFRFGTWPAQLAGISGFDSSEQVQVISALHDLNQDAGKTTIRTSDAIDPNAYPIYIVKKAPPTTSPNRAGLARTEMSQCIVEISPAVFSSTYSDFIKSVVWHELGHCAGLSHVDQHGEVMYKQSAPFRNYSQREIEDFFTQLYSSAGIR